MAIRMTISFKNTTKDMRLYSFITNQEEKSEFIKDAVDYYIKYLEEKNESNNSSR